MKKIFGFFLTVLFITIFSASCFAAQVLLNPKFQAFDDDGTFLSGGFVYTYENGTTTDKATYTTATLGTSNANPVVLDTRGEPDTGLGIHLDGVYTIVLKDSDGIQIWSLDNVEGQGSTVIDFVMLSEYADIAAAKIAIGATETTLWLDDAQAMDEDVTLPATLSVIGMKGNIITTTGWTLTINGPFEAGLFQVVDGTGTLTFGANSVPYENPEWRGGIGDDSTDCEDAFNDIIASGKPIYLTEGQTYLVKSQVAMDITSSKIMGLGTIKRHSDLAGAADILITADDCSITDITYDGDDNTNARFIRITSAENTRITNVTTKGMADGYYFVLADGLIENLYVEDNCHTGEGWGFWLQDPDSGTVNVFVRRNNFHYNGTQGGFGDGINFNCPTNGMDYFDISGNVVRGYPYDAGIPSQGLGIAIANCHYGSINNNIVKECEHDSIHIEDGCYMVNVHDNKVLSGGFTSYIGIGMGIQCLDSNHITIKSNNILNIDYANGISVMSYHAGHDETNSWGNKVLDNILTTIDRAGISVEGQQDLLIADNGIFGASQETTNTYPGITLWGYNIAYDSAQMHNVIIRDNTVADSGNVVKYAFEITASTNGYKDITLKDNNFVTTTNKMSIHANINDIFMKDNRITTSTMNYSTYAANQTLEYYEQFDHFIKVTAAATITLKKVMPGMKLLVYSTGANAVHIDPVGTDVMTLDGTALAAGDKLSAPAAAAGEWIELEYFSSGNWVTTNRNGVWIDGN